MSEEHTINRYRHFKGGEYEVICVAAHEVTGDEFVIYRAVPVRDTDVWARAKDTFNGMTWADGKKVPRFQHIVGTLTVLEHITDLEAENRELREKYDGAVKECQQLTDLLAMRGEE